MFSVQFGVIFPLVSGVAFRASGKNDSRLPRPLLSSTAMGASCCSSTSSVRTEDVLEQQDAPIAVEDKSGRGNRESFLPEARNATPDTNGKMTPNCTENIREHQI